MSWVRGSLAGGSRAVAEISQSSRESYRQAQPKCALSPPPLELDTAGSAVEAARVRQQTNLRAGGG